MCKKIIILNGSPRKKGNTAALTAEFIRGAQEAGNTVTEFFLGDMDIEYWYDRLEKHLGWKNLGKILCGEVMAVGDIKGRKELNDTFELGRSIS